MLVLTCFGNDQTGDLRKIRVREEKLTEVQSFGDRGNANQGSPAAIAIGESGYCVVSWVGSLDQARDSRLAFYNPIDGSRLMTLSTDRYDILALTYSPKSGNLYAADVAWMDAAHGGVFRIEDASKPGSPRCIAVKVADVLRPSALVFAPDGALYVTAFGELDTQDPQGSCLRITGDL
jgi:hypothetical protein